MRMSNSSFQKSVFVSVLLIFMYFILSPAVYADDMVGSCLGKKDQENCFNTDDRAGEEESESASSSIGVFDYIKVLFALAAVIGLLIFVLRYLNKKNASYQQTSMMKNLGGLSLGTQKSAQLIQIGNRLYIVGVGENISLLKEIDDEEEAQQLLNFYEDKQQQFTSTAPFIKQLFTKKKEQKETTASFGELFGEKISDIKQERSKKLNGWKEQEKEKKNDE